MDELRVLSVCGNLGYGFPKASLENGLARDPHIMGVDNGSTDAGPAFRRFGARVRYRPADLEAWASKQRWTSISDERNARKRKER